MGQYSNGCCSPKLLGGANVDDVDERKLPYALAGDSPASSSQKLRVVVLRHGERADQATPQAWYRSELGRRYPFDPPLTHRGRMQASEVAKELDKAYGRDFELVISSPFIRCIETAVVICKQLDLGLCVDRELGEIFAPEYFGDWEEPGPSLRSEEEVMAFVPKDVRLVGISDVGEPLSEVSTGKQANFFVGEASRWPETEGRLRLASRVEQLSNKASLLGGAHLVLVTHGDCVAASLALGLTGGRSDSTLPKVTKVPCCSYIVLERRCAPDEQPVGLLDEKAEWTVHSGSVQVRDVAAPSLLLMQTFSDKDDLQKTMLDLRSKALNSGQSLETMSLRRMMLLSNALAKRKASNVLKLQGEAGVTFKELLPAFPCDRRLTGESDALEDFASDREVE
eukprot:TRINITY_DN28203_c0_g1_i1.p1 TRINITY_DN28203_c0_g1~~TRINITY_DN28203_c0_g1_i1.p1  ORF type:complete len:405 (-),score=77.61 TRINITY_DN28203_c0_g1_i1:3-1190(-)